MDALSELRVAANVEKVMDVNRYVDYDVFLTPALVVDGKTKVQGRVPSKEEIKNWIREETL